MKSDERSKIIAEMQQTAKLLAYYATANGGRDGGVYSEMRQTVLDGLKLIDEQENAITALMGGFGDSCNLDKPCV